MIVVLPGEGWSGELLLFMFDVASALGVNPYHGDRNNRVEQYVQSESGKF